MKKYNSLLNYYVDRNFNPVPIKLNSSENYINHKKKRLNLLVNHLKIPEIAFSNSSVIEFGCNSGENSIVLAELNSKITLIEPNNKMIKEIEKNYSKLNLTKNLIKIYESSLEKYKTNKKYDFIIAEGFLNTLKDKNINFKKLISFGNKNSLIIINYDDKFGGYFEILKSCILKKYCIINNINFHSNESLIIAQKFFEKDFNKLSTSRNFNAWWNDQLVNPYATKLWSLREILNFASNNKCVFYSSSPSWDTSNNLNWYKNISYSNKSSKNKVFNSWKKNFIYFLTGFNEFNILSNKINNSIINDIEKSLFSMVNFLDSNVKNNIDLKKVNLKMPLKFLKTLKESNLKNAVLLSNEINDLFKILNNNQTQNLLTFYKRTRILRSTWGTLLHYICLKKI